MPRHGELGAARRVQQLGHHGHDRPVDSRRLARRRGAEADKGAWEAPASQSDVNF